MSDSRPLSALMRFFSKGTGVPIVLGLLITALVVWVQVARPAGLSQLIQRLDHLVYDQRFELMPKPLKNPAYKIVIVDIDERSMQVEGRFPWSRAKLALLVDKLAHNGVLVTGFDITFPEHQRNPVDEVLDGADATLPEETRQSLQQLEEALDADAALARSIANPAMDVALAVSLNSLQSMQYGTLPEPIVAIDAGLADSLQLQRMMGYIGNIAPLQEAADGAGIMNQSPDVDGVIRRVPLVLRYEDNLYPTLALEMARLFYFEDRFELVTPTMGGAQQIEAIRIGGSASAYQIPTDSRGQVLVPYVGKSWLSGEGQYPYISATDVMHDNVDPQLLDGALVLVGTTASGLFDLRPTPLEAVYPGVEVHANLLNGILSSFAVHEVDAGSSADARQAVSTPLDQPQTPFPYKPVWEEGAMVVSLVLGGVLLSLLLPHLGPAVLALVSAALVVALVWANFMLWAGQRMDLSLTLPLLLVLLLCIVNMSYGFLRERLTRKAIKGMFDQYVPPAHIDAMLKEPDNYGFAGESREMTVLFADIRDFTSVSEGLSASEVKQFLNDFFSPVTGIIFSYNGTIDKYVGDMVMAFWGAPLEDPNHRAHAVAAALDIVRRVTTMRQEFQARGLPDITIGVGVNTGMMNVGDMGSIYRRSYSVLGDAVNLGSRLEGLTRFYGVTLLVGEETVSGVDDFLFRLVDKVMVKGKDTAVRIHEPLCRSAEASAGLREEVALHHAALAHYFAQRWDSASRQFALLQAQHPQTALYGIYLDRIARLRGATLPGDWDGTWQHTEKYSELGSL